MSISPLQPPIDEERPVTQPPAQPAVQQQEPLTFSISEIRGAQPPAPESVPQAPEEQAPLTFSISEIKEAAPEKRKRGIFPILPPGVRKLGEIAVPITPFQERLTKGLIGGLERIEETLPARAVALLGAPLRALGIETPAPSEVVSKDFERIQREGKFRPFAEAGRQLQIGAGLGLQLAAPTKKIKAVTLIGKVGAQAVKSGVIGGANAAGRFVEELGKGTDVKESAKTALNQGVTAATISLGLGAIGGAGGQLAQIPKVKAALDIIAQATKKSTAFIGNIFASIPVESYELALTEQFAGRSIFNIPFTPRVFQKLGLRVQNAINKVNEKAGKTVGLEKGFLQKEGKLIVDTTELQNTIDNLIEQNRFGRVQVLEPKDIKILNGFKQDLQGRFPAAPGRGLGIGLTGEAARPTPLQLKELQGIKERINKLIKDFGKGETVKTGSSAGQGAFKQLGKEVNDVIRPLSPVLAEANDEASRLLTLRNRLKGELTDKNVERNIKNLASKQFNLQDLFEELDEVAPENLKFLKDLRLAQARDAFAQVFPGRGGGSGTQEGFANIARIALGLGRITLLPVTSPRAQRLFVRGVGAAPGLVGTQIRRAAGLAPVIGGRLRAREEEGPRRGRLRQ